MPLKLVGVLWMRLITFACVTALLVLALSTLVQIDGWLAYETGRQLGAEIGARVIIALGLALAIGTAVSVLALPYICWRPAASLARFKIVNRIAVLVAFIVCGSAVIGIVIRWGLAVGLLRFSNRQSIYVWGWLSVLLIPGTLACYFAVRPAGWTSRVSQSISGRTTRRLLLIAGLGGLLTGLSNGDPPPSRRTRPTAGKSTRPRPNILLVTFDALSAEDMSCFGYRLPTTPNIDSLAQSSYVFSNYFASSTFTTPCIASMLTGCYPSHTHVYHYGGSLRGTVAERTLPNLLRASGYLTAASVANPGAHPACLGFGGHFDVLPSSPLKDFATREAAALFHSAALADDVRRGANFVPYMLEQLSPRTFGQVHSTFPPEASFQQAQRMLLELPSPFFLWVHVFAPHFPYLPEPPFLHKFLRTDVLRTHAEFADMLDLTGYTYSAAKQPLIDEGRLRYNEWTAQADAAFGQFMSDLRNAGRLTDTAVIVSSDHGESFQGGFLGHGGSQQLRPILHVPLLVHLPGQAVKQEIVVAADQTALAPTILEIAGLGRPGWMDGQSLLGLSGAAGDNRTSRAFTQFLAPNSSFEPVTRGTVGVIDGQHQFVLDLEKNAGALFDLAEAHDQKVDRSPAEPALAANLRAQIVQEFPEIFGRQPDEA
jgi:arylsulfatase A-like enzyme